MTTFLARHPVAAVSIGLLLPWGLHGVTHAAGPSGPADPHRGGALRLLSTAGAGTIDPHVNYTLQYAQVVQATYDGLVAFRKAAGSEAFKLVPDLAEAIPKPEDGGKRYVFKLRKGIRFSDGREVTLDDAVASFRRIFKVLGPTAGSFYNGIVGAQACLKKPDTCTLAGGVIADAKAGTLTINLVSPDAEFFYKLAVPHAVILPADAPPRDVGVTPVPGTGPYKIVAYDPQEAAQAGAQHLFQGLERRRSARWLRGRHRLRLRPFRRRPGDGHRQRPGRFHVQPAAGRPPGRGRRQIRQAGAYLAADGDVLPAH